MQAVIHAGVNSVAAYVLRHTQQTASPANAPTLLSSWYRKSEAIGCRLQMAQLDAQPIQACRSVIGGQKTASAANLRTERAVQPNSSRGDWTASTSLVLTKLLGQLLIDLHSEIRRDEYPAPT